MELFRPSHTPPPTIERFVDPTFDSLDASTLKKPFTGGLVDIEVSVVTGRGLRNTHRIRRKPVFSVELTLDNETKTTDAKPTEDGAVTWNAAFLFSANVASFLQIRVYCRHRHSEENHEVGEASIAVLSGERNKDVEIELRVPGGLARERPSPAFITLHLKAALSVIFKPEHDPDMDFRSESFLKQMERIIGSVSSENLQQLPPAWIRLFTSLKTFSSLAQAVAELDSRAKVAVGSVAFAIKVMADQITRDEKIDNLGRIMCELYAYVVDACSVQKIISFERTLQRLLTQTSECAYFIADYRRISMFIQRAVVNIVSNADSMISSFETAFGELKIALILGSSLQTTLISYRVLKAVEHIVDRMLIDRLPILEDVSWDSEKTCLRGTREATTSDILHRASCNLGDMTSTSCVYILSGPIASGKSTIAHTIAKVFHEQNRLGVAIFLDGRGPEVTAKRISSTIIHQLAGYDSSLHAQIAAKIKADQSLICADIKRQFRALMIETMESAENKLLMIGPILVVIDGLDGIDDEEQLKTLTALAEYSGSLPPNFRILLTCRNDNAVVNKTQRRLTGHMRDIGFDDNGNDNQMIQISTSQLLSQSLADVSSQNPKFSTQYQLDDLQTQLEKRSRGIYFWVSTHCRSLLACEHVDPCLLLSHILSERVTLSNEEAMDNLYQALFKVFFLNQVGAHLLFDALIQSAQPIPLEQLRQIAFVPSGCLTEGTDVDAAQRLGLIIETDKDEQGVSLFSVHPTLEDFLTNPHRCYGTGVYIDRGTPLVRSSADACFHIMNQSLRHNICNVEDIMIMNHALSEKDVHVEILIPRSLQYACCNWAKHFHEFRYGFEDKALFHNLRDFVFTHILHWIEVMSLLDHFDDIQPSLFRLFLWMQKRKIKNDIIYMLAADAIQFIKSFSTMISKAALQTYVSVLPLMPYETLLFRQFSKEIIGRSIFNSHMRYRWPGHAVQSLCLDETACCCNHGSLIAVGSLTKGVYFMDSRIAAHVECNVKIDDSIQALTFSPDGGHLATVTVGGQVSVHNVKNGACVHSFKGNLYGAFIVYSHDGSIILVVSKPRESPDSSTHCHVFDTLTGDLRVLKAIPIRDPSMIALSPDEKSFALPNELGVQLFETDAGERVDVIAKHSRMLTRWESSQCLVTWSPNGTFLAIASVREGTIRVWSSQDDNVNGWTTIIDRARCPATSCALNFSSDSSQLAFAKSHFDDRGNSIFKIEIWDTETAQKISEEIIDEGRFYCSRRQLSLLPGGREFIIVSDAFHRSDVAFKSLVNLWSTLPIYRTDPSTSQDSQIIPTIFLTFFTKKPSYEYASKVDVEGWVINSEGTRMFMVPYPNFNVFYRPSVRSSTLDIKHPESMKTVLKYVIEWSEPQ